jgi:hypothetical protein
MVETCPLPGMLRLYFIFFRRWRVRVTSVQIDRHFAIILVT